MFRGVSAFPLTPLKNGTFDEQAFTHLLSPVVEAGVYSVLAGLFPKAALAIARSGKSTESERLEPLWDLFRRYGSVRVIAAAAEMRGKVATPGLPFPLQAIQGEPREALSAILAELELA
ncbi:hypothetical protein [Enterobacter cloacae]|uniref:Dihydrodipicolinate synthase n=1 Tax=Enterobacter cloacae subsp. cloacae TaxID=336306 RepID=A0AAE2EE08_ENTCL|nr:hypothetical protein [Enterobacter cloacae]EGQ5293047.1 hypothetical protein [Enterobacter cloacae]EKX4004028.1 hypothetical protein [Enterobacter cloacae]EKX4082919.1 hypothetical protein [Enterobacter cloacae]ELE9042408.1 hypothetical protein [Enterobacter cloacae]KJM39010.1 hypothetical protein SS44_09160 [Enterobacter cloacae subsp. cloacae]